eukprot:1882799-Rhodomonas_salina.2
MMGYASVQQYCTPSPPPPPPLSANHMHHDWKSAKHLLHADHEPRFLCSRDATAVCECASVDPLIRGFQ